MYGKHRSAKEIPSQQKTVKIKQAKPYYRSLQEHCWVSTEWETERVKEERERGREGEGNHAGQSLTLTMCTEMKGLKLNPHIPLALWQASEKCCSAHVIPYYLTSARDAAVYLLSRVTLCTSSSPSPPIHSEHFWTTHPTPAKASPAQGSSLSLWAKDSTLGSGKGANHMLTPSATNTLWQRRIQFTHLHELKHQCTTSLLNVQPVPLCRLGEPIIHFL